jgi:hypothetical protein
MADDEKGKKCKHTSCDCMAPADGDYCSRYCEDAHKAGINEIGCSCQHDDCG